MARIRLLAAASVFLVALLAPNVASGLGQISGTFVSPNYGGDCKPDPKDGTGCSPCTTITGLLQVMDATNAVVVATSELSGTNDIVEFNVTGLPYGAYKLRLDLTCSSGSSSERFVEFYSSSSTCPYKYCDEWSYAEVVPVSESSPNYTITNYVFTHTQPAVYCVVGAGEIYFSVQDKDDSSFIPNINFSFLIDFNAQPANVTLSQWDVGGLYSEPQGVNYAYNHKWGCWSEAVKIRVVDPSGAYAPAYYVQDTTSPSDDFDLATVVHMGTCADVVVNKELQTYGCVLSVKMAKVPPAMQVLNLKAAVASAGLPAEAQARLDKPLNTASSLLTDKNPANDSGTCGLMIAFINQIRAEQKKGLISDSAATELLAGALQTKESLGCP